MYISNIWEFLILPSWICNINALKSLYSNPTQKTFISTTHTCGGGNGTPLHYFCLENPMDGGAWWATVHGVAKSRTWLSDFTFTFHFHALKKEMATHSSVLAWRIPGTGESWWAAVYGVAQSRTRLQRLSSSSSSTHLILWFSISLPFPSAPKQRCELLDHRNCLFSLFRPQTHYFFDFHQRKTNLYWAIVLKEIWNPIQNSTLLFWKIKYFYFSVFLEEARQNEIVKTVQN